MGRGGKKVPKRYLKRCPVCKIRFRAKYLNRIYCTSKCNTKAFLEKYPDYHSRYYSKYFDRWSGKYKDNEWKAQKTIIVEEHLGTERGDIRSKDESENWDSYLKYLKEKRVLF